jgi:parallel beta-helix repeat protein
MPDPKIPETACSRRGRHALAAAAAVVLAPGAPAAALARPVVIHVAPDGDDRWTGRLDAPDAARRDGPLASLDAARDAVRTLLVARSGLPHGSITVELRGGRYERATAFVLGPQDSGAPGAPITYRVRAGETAVLDGGRPLVGLRAVTDPAVLARLAPAARGHVVAVDLGALGVADPGPVAGGGLELFFEHAPMTLARWPDQGFATIAGVVGTQPVEVRGARGDRGGVVVYDGDRPSRWLAEPDPWVHGYWFWDWADDRQPIAAIDPDRRTLALAPPMHPYGYRAGQWYYAFNLLAELDAPGEWYVDRRAGVLYFWPPGPGTGEVSVAPRLLVVEGAHDVRFVGLGFEAARGDAIAIRGAERVELADCTIRNVGGWAVQITGGRDDGVTRCEIAGAGEGGIRLEGGDRRALVPGHHRAIDNHIHHYARWVRTRRPGVELVGVGHEVIGNHIHDAPHIAIWFSGNDHRLERNVIERVCEEANDAGAIYAGRDWTMRGTVIRDNVIRGVRGFRRAGCNGVMLDDLFSGTTIVGNRFEDVTRGVLVGGGRDNTIDGNTFSDCDVAIRVDGRGLGWAAYSIAQTMRPRLDAMPYRTPPWSTRYPALAAILDAEPAAPRGNRITRNVAVRCALAAIEPSIRPLIEIAGNAAVAPR